MSQASPLHGAPSPTGAGDSIAGRIEAKASTLDEAVAQWCGWLASRKKRASSIAVFRQTVTAGAKACGWRSPADLTFPAVTEYLGSRTTWKASTYNRNLSIFRSFTRWAVASQLIEADPLILAVKADADPAEGSRAATTEEARAMLRVAWAATINDRRTRGNRAAYWACLFLAGCRAGEPELWTWGDLHLDEPIPFVLWRPDMHKARRRQEVALAPELAEILRAHRETVPHEPADKVFPVVPPRTTFRADRDRAGIPEKDRRLRRVSPHSARKWYRTTLADAGVQADLCDYLTRHALTVSARYCDFSLEAQAAALQQLPGLWCEKIGGQLPKSLDNTAGKAEDVSATFEAHCEHQSPDDNQIRSVPRKGRTSLSVTSREPERISLSLAEQRAVDGPEKEKAPSEDEAFPSRVGVGGFEPPTPLGRNQDGDLILLIQVQARLIARLLPSLGAFDGQQQRAV